MNPMLLYQLITILSIVFIADCDEKLFCYSCDSQLSQSCDENSICSTDSNGLCSFQQIIGSNDNILRTIRSCLNITIVTTGQFQQTEQCIETFDPNTNTRYRTFLCNNNDYCNIDCPSQIPITDNPIKQITTVRGDILECFKCSDTGTDCYNNTCAANENGYCFFQLLNVTLNGVRNLHYHKQCIDVPFAITPDGNSITEINKCIISTDILGNRFYTFICNETNLCNANCNFIPNALPIPVISRSSYSRNLGKMIICYQFLAISLLFFNK